MSDPSTAEFSMLLWLQGALVMALALHLGNGWVRRMQLSPTLRGHWPALVLAAAALGTGLCAAMVLGMQAEALSFPVGYAAVAAGGLLAAGMVACVPVVLMQSAGSRGSVLMLSGVLLATVAVGLECGWVWAAGFRPGVLWRPELVGGALVLQVLGLSMAAWMSFSEASKASDHCALWRLAAVGLVALTVMGGQTVMLLAAGVVGQRGSVHQSELPGTVLSLIFGVLVPLALAAASLDLWLRQLQQRRHQRGHGDFNPVKRRKRRHRVREL